MKYSQRSVVILACGLVPQFGMIHDIVLDDLQQPFLVCEKLITRVFLGSLSLKSTSFLLL